jgi:hypothetical protein
MRSAQEFMDEDWEEDIVGLVLWCELLATDGAVGASEVAGFPGSVQGAEGGGHVLGELCLMAPLRNLSEEEIHLELIDEMSPGVIKIAGPFLCVLMPMRF